MAKLNQSGVFYLAQGSENAGAFPEDCKRGLKNRVDHKFVLIFSILFFVLGTTVIILSRLKPPDANSEQDIIKLQERYANLVLNKEMPKPEEKKPVEELPVENKTATQEIEEAKSEEVAEEKRATETVVEKVARKEATSVQRSEKREAMRKQIENVGLFAELTAGGSGGGKSKGKAVQDLIGSVGASSSLSNISISGESFSDKKSEGVGVAKPGGRRGERTESATIGTSSIATASTGTLKSEGQVEMSKLSNVSGEASGDASRDIKTLNKVLQRYQPRLKKVFEDFLKKNNDLSGKIVFKLTIEADGSVSSVNIVSSELNDRELERNLVRYVERIKFDPASGKLTIEWPIVFSAS